MIDLEPKSVGQHFRDNWIEADTTMVCTTAQVAELLRRERERCAKVCDSIADETSYQDGRGEIVNCASAIRALPGEIE